MCVCVCVRARKGIILDKLKCDFKKCNGTLITIIKIFSNI